MRTCVPRKRQVRSALIECVTPDFSHDEPFAFICNARLDLDPWTPARLMEESGVYDFGKLKFVKAIVTTANIDIDIPWVVEAWTANRVLVHLCFPPLLAHPTAPRDHVFGMKLRDCYHRTQRGWQATQAFKDAVRALFANDPMVRIE
jgi:hypothetical protein